MHEGKTTMATCEHPTWHDPIQGYFTDEDIAHMEFLFDLSDYEEARDHAEEIYKSVAEGWMPPDEPWPEERVACFKKWMDAGFPED